MEEELFSDKNVSDENAYIKCGLRMTYFFDRQVMEFMTAGSWKL